MALSDGNQSLVLYDIQTHRQTELARGAALIYPCWSHDGKAAYFQDILEAPDQPIYRVRIADHNVERVTNVAQPFAADVTGYRLTGLTPDDNILATLIRGNSDLYTLDVDFPQFDRPVGLLNDNLPSNASSLFASPGQATNPEITRVRTAAATAFPLSSVSPVKAFPLDRTRTLLQACGTIVRTEFGSQAECRARREDVP